MVSFPPGDLLGHRVKRGPGGNTIIIIACEDSGGRDVRDIPARDQPRVFVFSNKSELFWVKAKNLPVHIACTISGKPPC